MRIQKKYQSHGLGTERDFELNRHLRLTEDVLDLAQALNESAPLLWSNY